MCVFVRVCESVCVSQEVALSASCCIFFSMASQVGMATKGSNVCEIY